MKYFIKINIISAFNNLRVKKGLEYLTTFRIRLGLFKSLIMPFSLTSAPTTFQQFINNTLGEYLDDFYIAYLDDILIYSRTRKEYTRYIRQVLKRLRNTSLYTKLLKCEFIIHKIKFLGLIIGRDSLRIDPNKIKTIVKQGTPIYITNI